MPRTDYSDLAPVAQLAEAGDLKSLQVRVRFPSGALCWLRGAQSPRQDPPSGALVAGAVEMCHFGVVWGWLGAGTVEMCHFGVK